MRLSTVSANISRSPRRNKKAAAGKKNQATRDAEMFEATKALAIMMQEGAVKKVSMLVVDETTSSAETKRHDRRSLDQSLVWARRNGSEGEC